MSTDLLLLLLLLLDDKNYCVFNKILDFNREQSYIIIVARYSDTYLNKVYGSWSHKKLSKLDTDCIIIDSIVSSISLA